MSTLATTDIATAAWTAIVLVALAFLAFISRRATEMLLTLALRVVRGRSKCRSISTAGHREIISLLQDLRAKTQAFRVCVYQFHNGVQFFRANHVWKLSMSHEVAHPGVSPINWKESNDLPIVAVMELAGPMIDDDTPDRGVRLLDAAGHRAAHYDVNNMPVCVVQALANTVGVSHVYGVNLVDTVSHDTIGLLAVQFDALTADDIAECDQKIPDMVEVADKIQFYLTTDFAAFRKQPSFFARLLGA